VLSGPGRAEAWQPHAGVFDDLLTAVVALDALGRIVYANRAAGQQLSGPVTTLRGRPAAGAVFPEQTRGMVAELVRRICSGASWSGALDVVWQGRLVSCATAWSPTYRGDTVVGALVVIEGPTGGAWHAQRLADRLRRLAAVTTELLAATDFAAVTSVVTEHLADAAGATVSSLSLLAEGTLTLVGLRGGPEHAEDRWARYPLDAITPVGDCLRARRPLVLTGREIILERYPDLELATGGERSMVCLPLLASGRPLGAVTLSFPGERAVDAAELEYLGVLADACAQAIDRIQALAAAGERELKLTFLADASIRLASSLDYQATLSAVAQLAVPQFADWCVIQLLQDDVLRPLALAHPDAIGEERIRELQARYPPNPDAPGGAHEVARTGRSELVPDITDDMLAQAAVDEEHLRVLQELNFRSAMTVPLKVHDRVLGVVTWVAGAGGRRYGPEDLAFAEDLARRAAIAIDNAELHSEVRDVALHLQHAVLPERLPHPDGWEVAVQYRPAGRTDIGGDFYDLIALDDGSVAVFVGDVMGRGVQAASAMAQMRAAVRALLAVDQDPTAVMTGLDKLFDRFDIDQLVTLVYAVVDPNRHLIQVINAGHPPPALVHADGRTELLQPTHTLLLGAGGGVRDVVTGAFADTDTLLLFTDGLAERRGEIIDDGYRRITTAASTLRAPNLQAALDELVDAVQDPTRDDDVAAIALRAKVAHGLDGPLAHDQATDRAGTWTLPGDARAAGLARKHVASFCRDLPEETMHTAVLLASELITNATAHGTGPILVGIENDGTHLRIEVRDESTTPPVVRQPSLMAENGRGLHIIEQLATSWGTTPVPARQGRLGPPRHPPAALIDHCPSQRCSTANSRSPTRSASASAGTDPAGETKFRSSNLTEVVRSM